MKRYHMDREQGGEEYEHPTGSWIRFEDHEKAMSEMKLDQGIAQLNATNAQAVESFAKEYLTANNLTPDQVALYIQQDGLTTRHWFKPLDKAPDSTRELPWAHFPDGEVFEAWANHEECLFSDIDFVEGAKWMFNQLKAQDGGKR